ncbi:Non-canonical poly(A) RNA polymerase PAPD7 [Portunus trituberculatus]|uniref:Non-canonical poly(A) RNA polymerase PAPD7 n=1 Tax=Portunus trituberculatus TaxID=210409 RepID=A0A5B7G3D0_PORTR|nr:Non-canonical poly(A) RNA polymerase PAPD7 [Portunus trituberculatus]
MVYNKHIKETQSEYPALSTLEILSQQSIVMEGGCDTHEEPKKACCFSWVRCCIQKLCRRLRKRNRTQQLAVSLPHGETDAEELEMNEPFNNIMETNNVVEEEQEKDNNSVHLNDEPEAEGTAILQNEHERTEENESTTRGEPIQKKRKRTRRRRKKKNKKKAQNNEEEETIVVEEEEGRMTLPEGKVEQEREKEHSGEHDKSAERTQRPKRTRRRRNKKHKSQNNVENSNDQSSCTIKESAPAELLPTIETVAVPAITGEEPVTGVEQEGAEHHTDEEQEQEEGIDIDKEEKLGEKDTEEEEKVTIVEVSEVVHTNEASTQPAAACTPPPWQCPQPSYNGSLQALTQEVLDFHRWAGGSEAESRRRMRPVEDVKGAVGALWPAARVEITGSLANGMYLPDSDVDLTLVGQWPLSPSPLLVLRDTLLQQGVALPASLKVLEKTTVPLVKFVHRQTGVEVDVSLGGEAAVRAAVLVADFKKQFKTLTPVALFVRYYLKQLNLGQVFTGGVSSYSVTLMATSLLQLQVPPEEREDPALVLLRFFYFYGHQFAYATTGISVLEGGRYLRKEDVPTVMPRGHRRADLCIQDPLTPGNDLGRSSFRVWEAQRAFQHAYLVLSPAAHAPGRYTWPCSLLGQLLLGYGAPARCLPNGWLQYHPQCAPQQQCRRLPQQGRHHNHQQSSHLAAHQEHHILSRPTLQQNNQNSRHRGSNGRRHRYQQGHGEVYHHRPQQQRHHTVHHDYHHTHDEYRQW